MSDIIFKDIKMASNNDILLLNNQLCFPLYVASRLTIKSYAPFLSDLDITYPQYLVLLVLWEKDIQTVNQISNKLYLETNTITPLLKRLEEKGILTRKRSASDERNVIVSLTEKGLLLKSKAITIPENIGKAFLDKSISKAEFIEFQKTLLKLVGILNNKLTANNNSPLGECLD